MSNENTPCTGNVARSSLLEALKPMETRTDVASALDDANDFLSELDDVTFTPKPATAPRMPPPARVVHVMETPNMSGIAADMTPIAPMTQRTGSPNTSYEIRRINVADDLNDTNDEDVDASLDNQQHLATVNAGPSTPLASAQQREETEEERVQRELAESEALALQLMQEESTHAYQMQLQMLQEMAGTMSEEELGAIRLALSEAGMIAPPQPRQARQRNRTEGEGDEGDEEADEGTYDDEEGDEEEEEASQEWSYEQLLELGERLGDVKTERWMRRAAAVIESLPEQRYCELQGDANPRKMCKVDGVETCEHKTPATPEKTAAEKCLVCMYEYEASDICKLLPCKHFFHGECIQQWLQAHNSCPTCKLAVARSP